MEPRVEVDAASLSRVVSALKRESDGKELSRDFVREMRVVATPALMAVRASIRSMSSFTETEPGLRAVVAARTTISVRTTGRRPGVSIKSSKKGMPRGFRNAPKNLNSANWRHPVYGQDRWVAQIGKPGWFDATLKPFREPATRAASAALHQAARRIDERSK